MAVPEILQNFDLEDWKAYIGPAAGVLAGLAALLVGLYLSARRQRGQSSGGAKVEKHADNDAKDPFTQGAKRERRSALRRGGNAVPILISDAAVRSAPSHGWVIDRSTGGLKLAVNDSMAPGTILSVRTSNAPQAIPWVQLEVKSCRQLGKEYELGCQFVRTPPWSVLLLFG